MYPSGIIDFVRKIPAGNLLTLLRDASSMSNRYGVARHMLTHPETSSSRRFGSGDAQKRPEPLTRNVQSPKKASMRNASDLDNDVALTELESETALSRESTLSHASVSQPTRIPAYGVAIVNYKTYDDVRHCMASVKRQSHPPTSVVLVDADSDDAQLESLLSEFPGLICESRPNEGFASGANRALARLHAESSAIEFMLLMNPDVELAPDFCERMLDGMVRHPSAGLASGKLVRPGEVTIDSTGITLPRNRRPRDRGSEELDVGQFEHDEHVFAASGAVLMLRTSALADLEIDGEIFDEDFFMYHEDTDLAWRASKLGWQSRYIHKACAIHTRRWRPHQRFEIEPRIRQHSFKNHYLQIIKNDELRYFLRDLPIIFAWEVVRLGYAILKDRALLQSYAEVVRLAPRAFRKRRIIRARMKHLRISQIDPIN